LNSMTDINNIHICMNMPLKRSFDSFLNKTSFLMCLYFSVFRNRIIEWVLAFFLFSSFSLWPFPFLLLRKISTGKSIFDPVIIYGQEGQVQLVKYYNFKTGCFRNLSLFYYAVINRLGIVGVSIKKHPENNRVLGDSCIYSAKPGIFNLCFIRKSTGISHEGMIQTEREYIFRKGLASDILLIIRSIPALFYHTGAIQYNKAINIFGLEFLNIRMLEAVKLLEDSIMKNEKRKVFFVNPDCLNKIFSDREYYRILNGADYVFPDGIGIRIAGKILRNPLIENVNGTDMLPFICRMAVKNNNSIFLLGGKPGITAQMKENLEKLFPGISIVGEHHGYFNRETENSAVVNKINKSTPDILLVAFGAPMQEKWISGNFDFLQCKVAMGVGGLFDFYSGNISRAPGWMREAGLEWIYRFIREPGRMWKRYLLGNPLFIYRVLKWKWQCRNNTILQSKTY
jgi:N-acetylglucosaminyldiphosphoundecaprenol N-acetyl-beta-D-mannosaminyltransferase